MNRDAMEKLRLDRRLINRRGWISKTELEKELGALQDVSGKIAPTEDAEPHRAGLADEPDSETADEPELGPPRVE